MPRSADVTSRIVISTPKDSEIWVDRTKIGSVSPVREFRTPPLEPDRKYRYTIRAIWTGADGQPVTETRNVVFPAGMGVFIHFPGRPKPADSDDHSF
jgi:uncharacterized protein (TIGR03000 family)